MSDTRSDVFGAATTRGTGDPQPALVIVGNGEQLALPPSRHLLADIDVVWFARGPRLAQRDSHQGLRRLLVQIPDPVMSTDHGRLLRVQDRWMLDDPASKNGAVVAGAPSRAGMVAVGDLVELGRTVFLLETVDADGELPLDAVCEDTSTLASLHPALVHAQSEIALIARSEVPITLVGETGTGKEVYAQAIHQQSGRPGPLIAINCGALSPSLLEAELFGHRRGAFSGATSDRPGFVRSADRGTLFLDEIGELSAAAQVALLRVLQEREVVPVGDSQPVSVDVRVCVASQRVLAVEVDAGRFRSDLYARLLGYELRLPTLRERACDLGLLLARLVARLAPPGRVQIAPAALRTLVSYPWPRNIRELERCLATALVLARDRPIDLEHLPEVIRATASGRLAPPPPAVREGEEPATAELREQLAAKLVEHRGNISAVARDLGKHREQIQRWLRRFGFVADAFRR